MDRTQRVGRIGGLAATAVPAAPFAWLWILTMRSADDPLTAQVRLDMAIWMAVFGSSAMLAAWLLWRAWWRQAGTRLSGMDDPALPSDRRDWGAAMAAELAQVHDPAARWRFVAGCARAALGVTGALAAAALVATALGTGADLPAGGVFALAFVGLLGGLATLTVARSRRAGGPGPGLTIPATALTGVAACVAVTAYYLAEYPSYHRFATSATVTSLSSATAVVLAVLLGQRGSSQHRLTRSTGSPPSCALGHTVHSLWTAAASPTDLGQPISTEVGEGTTDEAAGGWS